jgi:serine O-acetyltransferase
LQGSRSREIIKADLARWATVLHLNAPQTRADFALLFLRFMTFHPEFRNLFYLRTGKSAWPFLWMCPRLGSLAIESPYIGTGFFIQHGENTFVSADSIGANCWIGRHVVIGFSNDTDRPTIGDNVRIYPGAKIMGKVTIGDNATIGLNTVVIDHVQPNVTLLGVPGRVIGPSVRAVSRVAPSRTA